MDDDAGVGLLVALLFPARDVTVADGGDADGGHDETSQQGHTQVRPTELRIAHRRGDEREREEKTVEERTLGRRVRRRQERAGEGSTMRFERALLAREPVEPRRCPRIRHEVAHALAQAGDPGQGSWRARCYLPSMRVAGAALLVVIGGMAACGFTGEGTAVPGAGGPEGTSGATLDAGTDAAPDDVILEGGPGGDGAVEAGVDASACRPVAFDGFAGAGWELLESASVNGAGHAVLTTADNGSSAGAIWWRTPITFGRSLHVELSYTFDLAAGAEGDGLTVAWIPTTTKYVMGPQGQSYGICNAGLSGVAAAVDTRDDQLVIVGDISVCETNTNTVTATLLASRKMTVDLTPTLLTVTLDTGTTLTRNVNVSTTGYLGFTAATGVLGETGHEITGASAQICP